MNETELQVRLRRAKEALESNIRFEATLRKQLAECVESNRRAKERYEELFMAEEAAETARRKIEYRHSTI